MLAVLLAAALLLPQEPVRVNVLLSNDRPIVGEPTMLRITIETRDTIPDRIIDPVMPAGLEIIEAQDYSETRIAYPGGRNHITERRLIIVARVAGQFTIPSAMVHAAGRVYATRAIPLTASAGEGAGGRRDIDSRIDVEVSPDRVYVGQQILLEATAAFSRGLRSQQTRPATYTAPSPAGFWIHDVPEPLSVGMQTIEGELYETQTFRRVYFPLSPGTYRMPPARLQFELRRGFLSSAENFELVSDSPAIEVLPIPEEGRPAGFRGAVGRYTTRASVSPAQLSLGEAATLVLEIEGVGNVKALPAPPLPALPGVEVQPPTEDAETDTRGSEIGGIKRFTWVLVPERPGRVTVPPLEYTYFDPAAERFETARTGAVAFDVRGSAATDAATTALAPLARSPSRLPVAVLRSPVFLAAQLVPLVLLFVAVRWRSAPRPARATPRPDRSRPDPFAALRTVADQPTQFWPRFDAALRSAIADALNEPGLARAPTTQIATALAGNGVPRATTTTILELLREAERIRFAPGEAARLTGRDAVDHAERGLRAIERGHPDAPRGAGPLAILLIVAVALSAGQAAAQDASDHFREGVALYEDGRFAEAAQAFADYLSVAPHDANAWHDLGNARWSAGERGPAVHAWLRAVRLDPRHGSARTNLEAANGGADALLPPRFALSFVQAPLVLSVLWWSGLLGCAILALRKRRIWPVLLVTTIALAAAGSATLFGITGRDAGVALQDTQLLMAPALKAEAIGALPEGTLLQVIEERDEWVRVRIAGTEGWTESGLIGT